ncbi:ABC transporter ATP-binding protein [Rummeliibacillus stabekisii]|uniref:ABC transporter ATP-binding protein n=1 Tax=Rummeliibacillus stabekisii TaxID=241244 RepID=UPI00116AA35A|nr:ABC transporter ATP-binding protein [Rummeliibacillus stabekisii]MBB5171379.1 osmoprotectant transport system ATP-binding protein [Rummeliibacillus stabekisii]GEL06395.1 glycine/betaine ABC transporter ATP-binding protein [Rummeliibacillus stabekisii]
MIKFENVSKRYQDGTIAVDSLNLEIKKGEFFVLIGPSGCGKTTTLKMINRLIPLSDGTIFFDEQKISEYDIHELRWNIGYVLQQIALFPHMTIEENITVVPEMKKWSKEKMKERAYELMDMVGLDPKMYANRKSKELSGGEQQRVGVIRALAADPEIILMDEPFSALDPISRERLQDDMLDLKKNLKKTTVFVTHDMQEALKLADRICIMEKGKIVQIGTPRELVLNPANDFVKKFIGDQAHSPWMADVDLERIIQPLGQGEILENLAVISVSSSLKQVLDNLSQHEQLIVERDGEWIGRINRKSIIQLLSEEWNEGGLSND